MSWCPPLKITAPTPAEEFVPHTFVSFILFLFVKSAAHSTHAILGHAATPPNNKQRHNLTECFNISINLARLNCKIPDDGRRPKHVGAI